MIEIKDMDKRSFRTFGWVQDSGDFDSLYKVVSIFNEKSKVYEELINHKITELIEERDGRKRVLEELNSRPLKLKYRDLVGTAFSPRPSARCNGIVQATVKGQQRPFIGDWPADNFVRWAQCLGFIKYNYLDMLSHEYLSLAYSKGYDLPISQVDEMARYVEENNKRDKARNPNEWWNNFSKEINEFYFAFISGEFKGSIDEKLNRIVIETNRNGAAIAIISLIKLANEIKAERMNLEKVKDIFKNRVY